MNQINQTLNDINAVKGKILEKERLYEEYLNKIQIGFEKLEKQIKDRESSDDNFKLVCKIYEKVKKHYSKV